MHEDVHDVSHMMCGAMCGTMCGAMCGTMCGAMCGTTCGAILAKEPSSADVVRKEYAHGSAVVCIRDRAETLLTGRVPNLQLAALAVQGKLLYLEVNADGCDE